MSIDSLVGRLRAMARHEHDDLSIGEEAANEIERLREENVRLGFCRHELRAVTEAMDDPSINNMRSLEEAVTALLAENERLRADLETAERALDAQTDFRAEIKQLREENERLQAAHDWQYQMSGDRLRRVEKLEAEIERLKDLWFLDKNPMKTEYAAEWLRAIRNER